MSDTTPTEPVGGAILGTEGQPKKAATPTRRELEAALDALAPAPEPEPTAYEVERKKRLDRLGVVIPEIGKILRDLGILDSKDLVSAQKAVLALTSASKMASKAIEAIPDGKLGVDPVEEKPQRISRAPKRTEMPAPEPVADTPAVLDEAPTEKTLPGKGPDEVAADLREKQAQAAAEETEPQPDETPDEVDARIKANRAQRYQGRSVSAPAAESDPRGAEDPNAGDGF